MGAIPSSCDFSSTAVPRAHEILHVQGRQYLQPERRRFHDQHQAGEQDAVVSESQLATGRAEQLAMRLEKSVNGRGGR